MNFDENSEIKKKSNTESITLNMYNCGWQRFRVESYAIGKVSWEIIMAFRSSRNIIITLWMCAFSHTGKALNNRIYACIFRFARNYYRVVVRSFATENMLLFNNNLARCISFGVSSFCTFRTKSMCKHVINAANLFYHLHTLHRHLSFGVRSVFCFFFFHQSRMCWNAVEKFNKDKNNRKWNVESKSPVYRLDTHYVSNKMFNDDSAFWWLLNERNRVWNFIYFSE